MATSTSRSGDRRGATTANQCANVTGNANTGNLQTQTGILQYDSEIEEFE